MKLLIVSDTHGDFYTLNKLVDSHPEAEVILHLGDGAEEINEIKKIYPKRMVIAVRGNCDLCSTLPEEEEITIDGFKIFMTHGNRYNVKLGLSAICEKAKQVNANILLFGHTHIALSDYQFGLYIFNPGTIKGARGSYGIIDTSDSAIVTEILKVNFEVNPTKQSFFFRKTL